MSKCFIIFLIIFTAVNFTAAAHSGCGGSSCGFGDEGFTAGLEFGFEDVNTDNRKPYLRGIAGYGHSFFDRAFDVYAELNYTIGFNKQHEVHSVQQTSNLSSSRCLECDDDPFSGYSPDMPHRGNEAFPQSLYFNLMLGYNLRLGFDDEATLSFILQNEFDELIINPRYDASNNITGIFTPAVKFNYELDRGDIYSQIGLPVTYIQNKKNADPKIGFDFTAGWTSLLGLELKATLFTLLKPDVSFDGLEFKAGYDLKPFYFALDFFIPIEGIDHRGVNIIPEIEFTFGAFTIYANCALYHIGGASGLYAAPALGFRFNF